VKGEVADHGLSAMVDRQGREWPLRIDPDEIAPRAELIDDRVRVKIKLASDDDAALQRPARLSVFPGTNFEGRHFPDGVYPDGIVWPGVEQVVGGVFDRVQ
jgi:hypothetical protein